MNKAASVFGQFVYSKFREAGIDTWGEKGEVFGQTVYSALKRSTRPSTPPR
jgi:hypothetical protein